MTWFIILTVVTCGLALGLPPDPHTLHQLHISSATFRVALVALLVPYGVIWYAAFYAFAHLKDYAHTIRDFEDGRAFRNIMIGMGVLAFSLVLPTTFSLVLQNVTVHHQSLKPAFVIFDNYFGLFFALTTFIYIGNGTHALVRMDKGRPGLTGFRIFALLFIILAVSFTYVVIHYHIKHNLYYLNTPLLIATFIIPALFAWFMALMSAYEIRLYAKHAKGLLYRGALQQFSYGIVAVITGSVAIQFLDNTVAEKAGRSLGVLVLLDYGLLAIYALGLILMALGTKKLKKIEEV